MNSKICLAIATFYLLQDPVRQPRALRWLIRAHQAGSSLAASLLGFCFEFGLAGLQASFTSAER